MPATVLLIVVILVIDGIFPVIRKQVVWDVVLIAVGLQVGHLNGMGAGLRLVPTHVRCSPENRSAHHVSQLAA